MRACEIVETIINRINVHVQLEPTFDIYVSGTPETEVTGIVTTFMATVDVIREAIRIGANMIITHEPTYFTGWDRTDWLENDPVYLEKKRLIEDHHIVIWRFHDRMHLMKPDGIYEGLLKELDWEKYRVASAPEEADQGKIPAMGDFEAGFCDYYAIPTLPLGDLALFFKTRLHLDVIQIIGDPSMKCSRVGILVGGGSLGLGVDEMPMTLMREKELDVIVCGEITEWTLCAYVNDAQMLGFNRALLIIGHERSEEWGMKYMAEWLAPLVPGLPVAFMDAKEPFRYL